MSAPWVYKVVRETEAHFEGVSHTTLCILCGALKFNNGFFSYFP
jgi:hypothetical protein